MNQTEYTEESEEVEEEESNHIPSDVPSSER